MALIWTFIRFILCLLVVEAFPKFPRSPEYGYVIYKLPERCVAPPERDTICNLDYSITSYTKMAYGNITRSIDSAYESVKKYVSQDCAEAMKRLFCKSSFPECLDQERLDYGEKKELFADVNEKCSDVFASHFLNATAFRKMQSGIHEDPHAGFNCVDAGQDPASACPKPKYKLPSSYVNKYYSQVKKYMRELDENKDHVPDECYEKAKNVFTCAYPFCLPNNKQYLVMTVTRQQCESVRVCLDDHGKLDEDTKEFLDKTCPKYPDKDSAEEVELPATV